MGRPKSLKQDGLEGQSGHRPKGLPKRTNACSTTSSAHLSDWSTRFGHQPPPGGLRSEGLAQNTASYSDPASPTGSLLTALLRLARPVPTRALRPGIPTRKGPGANGESSAQSQNTVPGPYPVRLWEQCSTTDLTQAVWEVLTFVPTVL